MEAKNVTGKTFKILIPLLISAAVLWYTYRNYDFNDFGKTLGTIDMKWLGAALLFSLLGPLFRGLRWDLLLRPIGYTVPKRDTNLIVFTGYAANIIIPRFGEISRCAILDRKDHVPFSKSLGTLIAERFVDMILLVSLTGITVLTQYGKFVQLFSNAGAKADAAPAVSVPFYQNPKFYILTGIILISAGLCIVLWKKLGLHERIKGFIVNLWEGFIAIRQIDHLPLFLLYSVSIWICYYFEMYLAFFSMESTSAVGPIAGLVCFVAGSIAVLVPTPNGAGPWHFAIINMLLIYGVPDRDAQTLALVLHTSQTACYLLAGAVAWVLLELIHKES